MTARILVVDDIAVNRKLMSARLGRAYYEIFTAGSGEEALDLLARERVDLVLLDVMMPGIGGYETCRRIKQDPATADVPVVLVTSLDQPRDRLEGLEAGADDFLVKPVKDLSLLSRVRSLSRLKLASDDLKAKLGVLAAPGLATGPTLACGIGGSAVLLADDAGDRNALNHALRRSHAIELATTTDSALMIAAAGKVELALIALTARGFDPLRLCSLLRSAPATRHLPILVAAHEAEEPGIWKALDLGANDYVPLPVDRSELLARAGTHIRRRREDEALKESVRSSADMAFEDPLTGLGNRRSMEARLAEFVSAARRGNRPFCILIADLDHFKRINDEFGHSVGDAVLAEFAGRLRHSIRGNDIACRYGGEEFVVLMDGADEAAAVAVAERLRQSVGRSPFAVEGHQVGITVSIGLAQWETEDESPSLLRRADRALYQAKRTGRDRVRAAATV